MEKGESVFSPQDRIGQLTMRNLDITDTRDKLLDLREDRAARAVARIVDAAALRGRAGPRQAGAEVAMTPEVNALGQPMGFTVDDWTPPPRPPLEPMAGRTCRLEPLDAGAPRREPARGQPARSRAAQLDLPAVRAVRRGSTTISRWVSSVAGRRPQFHAVSSRTGSIDLATGRSAASASPATCASIPAPGRSRSATSTTRRGCSAPSPRPRRCT